MSLYIYVKIGMFFNNKIMDLRDGWEKICHGKMRGGNGRGTLLNYILIQKAF